MQNELPEWAMNTGLEIANGSESLGATIARALLAAERRGIERAAMVAEKYGDGGLEYDLEPEACVATSVASKSIATAIRQLGAEE